MTKKILLSLAAGLSLANGSTFDNQRPAPATVIRFLLAVLFLALRLQVAAQAPAWQSARAVAVATAAATNPFSEVRATAIDAAGNVYLAGNFSNTVALGGTTLTSLGSFDVFVAKFSPASNQFVWAQRAGGTDFDYVNALAVNGPNVYVAGEFRGPTAGFGLTTLTNAGTTGYSDVFVAKLTDAGSAGSFAWAQRAGGTNSEHANALAVSGTSVYVAGYFYGTPTGFGASTLTNAGASDVFVAKLTDAGPTGSFVWGQRAGGTGNDEVNAVAMSGPNVYVAGNFAGPTAGIGPATLTNADNTGSSDVFVAKLTDAGNTGSFAWAQRAGGTDTERTNALAVSGTSVYVAGYFYGATTGFGAATLTNANPMGSSDVFVAKLTDAGPSGSFTWAQQAGGAGSDEAGALAVSGTSVYLAGDYASLTVGFGATTLTNAGAVDVFVAKLTDAGGTGSFAWAQRAGGAGNDFPTALAVSGNSLYVAGALSSATAGFGPTTLTNTGAGSPFGFLASLTDPTLTATAVGRVVVPGHLFPNPAHGAATLRLPVGATTAPLTLTDALGRAVRRYPAPAGPEAALDLQGVPAGLYLLRGTEPAQRLVVE